MQIKSSGMVVHSPIEETMSTAIDARGDLACKHSNRIFIENYSTFFTLINIQVDPQMTLLSELFLIH